MSAQTLTSTIEPTDAARERWEVVVIGAGPAGSMAAIELARAGARVVIVDRRRFPRAKVCGDCLGGVGVRMLRDAGLGHVLDTGHSLPIDRIQLRCAGATLRAPSGGMCTIAREDLDTALLAAAIGAGAQAILGTKGELAGDGRVRIGASGESTELGCGAVVLACGLEGRTGGDTPRAHVGRRSLIGVGTSCEPGASCPPPGRLDMTVGRGGYVGCVRLGDGRENWGGALDPGVTRRAGGVVDMVRALLDSGGLDPSGVPTEGWAGTPALTRRRRVESGRVLLVGDAAGYVAPITGEGMSWALMTGRAVAPRALALARGRVRAGVWAGEYRRLTGARRRRCAAVAGFVRHPVLLRAAMRSAAYIPASASLVRTLIGARPGVVA